MGHCGIWRAKRGKWIGWKPSLGVIVREVGHMQSHPNRKGHWIICYPMPFYFVRKLELFSPAQVFTLFPVAIFGFYLPLVQSFFVIREDFLGLAVDLMLLPLRAMRESLSEFFFL